MMERIKLKDAARRLFDKQNRADILPGIAGGASLALGVILILFGLRTNFHGTAGTQAATCRDDRMAGPGFVSFTTDGFSDFAVVFSDEENPVVGAGDMTPMLGNVTIADSRGEEVGEDGRLYVGEKYNIHLEFEEGGVQGGQDRQFRWTEDGKMTYQIPGAFEVRTCQNEPLHIEVNGRTIQVGTYSVDAKGLLTVALTGEGKTALENSRSARLTFDMQATAQAADGSEDGKVHFGDTGQDFHFDIVDQARVDVEKQGVYEENVSEEGGPTTGGKLKYTVKTTVKHGQAQDLQIRDELTPPVTTAFEVKKVNPEDVEVTLKRAAGGTAALEKGTDYELEEMPDPENPGKKTFRVKLRGEYAVLYEGDELEVTYHYDVAYKAGSTDLFWGNVANDVHVTGTGIVPPGEGDPQKPGSEIEIDEKRGSSVEIAVKPPGDGIVFKSQDYAEESRAMHYTLYTVVPAGRWSPLHVYDDMIVRIGDERYYIPEFKKDGRVKNLTVRYVDLDSADPAEKENPEALKAEAIPAEGLEGFDFDSLPGDYSSDRNTNYVYKYTGSSLYVIFGYEQSQRNAWGNWGQWKDAEHDRLIITEYDLDMADDSREITLQKMGSDETLKMSPGDVLRAGITNTVNLRFQSWRPGYTVFFNNADRMNKTGEPDKNDNTIAYTVTLNTTDSTVNRYFRDVNADWAPRFRELNWDAKAAYAQSMQAVFHDKLPEGWEYVEGTLSAAVYDKYGAEVSTWAYDPASFGFGENYGLNEREILAPLVFFYNKGAENNREMYNWFGENMARLTFTYKLRAAGAWLKEHATDSESVPVDNYADIRDRRTPDPHWKAGARVPYLPWHLTKDAVQVENTNQLRFTLHVNPGGADLDEEKGYLLVTDTSRNLQIDESSIQVKDDKGNLLRRIADTEVGDGLEPDQWVLLPTRENGHFQLKVPDKAALTITYNALITRAGDDVQVSNEASIDGVDRTDSKFERSLKVDNITAGGSADSYKLKIEKADKTDLARKLPGAEFRFYLVSTGGSQAGTAPIRVGERTYNCYAEEDWAGETGDDGIFEITKGLEPGNYYILEEIKAPEGYAKLEEPILFYFGFENGIDKETYPDATFGLPNGALMVADPPIPYKLPESGGPGVFLYVVTGLVLALGSGFALTAGKRRGQACRGRIKGRAK